jgi:predicted ABC-type ATPase
MAGGHNIDTVTIHRRHRLGLESLAACWDACDEAALFDARTENPRETLFKDQHGTRVIDRFGWALLRHRLEALEARIPDTANY